MDGRFSYYILCGFLLGSVFGAGIGSANGNVLAGLGIGALIGVVFVSWFTVAADLHQR